MIAEHTLVAYKNKPALVKAHEDGKILISLYSGEQLKVREKDIELIHSGPVKNLADFPVTPANDAGGAAKEAWELLLAEGSSAGGAVPLAELAELAFGEYTAASAWAAYSLLLDGLYFSGSPLAVSPRRREDVEADEKKRQEKQRESGERDNFLKRLRQRKLELPDDKRFMQDVEALAYGKSAKSKTMRDLGMSETPEDAHALLLDTGFWPRNVNPYPARFGLSLFSAKQRPDPPPTENRRGLTHLAAFAIDSPWSHDPDDAVSIERGGTENGEGSVLYVHVADPASAIAPDSPVEREARDRGATLYLPEGASRMFADEALPLFALGLAEQSPALTFKITLGANGEIKDTDIFPSMVKVRRLTYEEADLLLDGVSTADNAQAADDTAMLRDLYALAEQNMRRRLENGAVNIELGETHISVTGGTVSIEPVVSYRSGDLVRECMLLAGEGAGLWAGRHNLAFPYVSQELGDIPDDLLPGMAGSYQLRRCMRPRTLSTKPGCHQGLGLDTYTQVTSPLRRYTDFLAHLQIRACLGGRAALSTDEVSARMGAGEAAAAATVQAERASRAHWTMIYLADKKDSVWDAIALEKKGNRWVLMIPALALETQVPLRQEIAPNETVKLVLKSVNIPKGEAVFVSAE
jgi:exoribonuclease-2